jgi:hypothetical protein
MESMTEFEDLVQKEIDLYTSADISVEDRCQSYWDVYIDTCTMKKAHNGMEMPHEENLTYSYHPNADEYNISYGW